MAAKPADVKVIKGQGDCVEYLKSIGFNSMSRGTLAKYIEAGLPCWFAFGTYHFHTEVLDDYFKHMCSQRMKVPPPEEKPEV